ncbi:hypothetical protein EV201_0873 [Ancylomarina subtilis]|uniref:Uncharacterized protein n=1 Tax=Ancylomarina subtilis TaxID=1639035 RepID=A0A4Q7VJJ8_9BACT|nr:hypothetical protein EV201_0873 [Ancylomarina subtilis]
MTLNIKNVSFITQKHLFRTKPIGRFYEGFPNKLDAIIIFSPHTQLLIPKAKNKDKNHY